MLLANGEDPLTNNTLAVMQREMAEVTAKVVTLLPHMNREGEREKAGSAVSLSPHCWMQTQAAEVADELAEEEEGGTEEEDN